MLLKKESAFLMKSFKNKTVQDKKVDYNSGLLS